MISIKNKYDFDCDVLIIGGGPAGSGLAYHLAKAGTKVIAVEAAIFPRDKVCGDGVSPIALAELHTMGITHTDRFKRANEISQVGLFIKNDKVVVNLSKPDHLPHHARIIPRLELDSWIYEAAKEAGARYLEDTRFCRYQITDLGVITSLKTGSRNFTIASKIIIGADGSSSGVARQLHGAKTSDQFQLLGLRAYYEDVSGPNNRVDIFFSKESFPGIYWMFPKGEKGANIGMAMISATLPQKPAHVKQLLQQHIENNKDIAERIGAGKLQGKILGWPITFFNAGSILTDNRILLVGDAAGLINPLSDDGIQYALLSARWASEVVIQSVALNDFSADQLQAYRTKVDKELAYDFAFSNFLVQFARNKSLSTVWMEIISTLIARAKVDKQYADTIAGVFEGTYPSHKALSVEFIAKSLLQGGIRGLESMSSMAKNPGSAFVTGNQIIQSVSQFLSDISSSSNEQAKWLGSLLNKGLSVAGHTINHVINTRTANK